MPEEAALRLSILRGKLETGHYSCPGVGTSQKLEDVIKQPYLLC